MNTGKWLKTIGESKTEEERERNIKSMEAETEIQIRMTERGYYQPQPADAGDYGGAFDGMGTVYSDADPGL
jgi:hypothetical protein